MNSGSLEVIHFHIPMDFIAHLETSFGYENHFDGFQNLGLLPMIVPSFFESTQCCIGNIPFFGPSQVVFGRWEIPFVDMPIPTDLAFIGVTNKIDMSFRLVSSTMFPPEFPGVFFFRHLFQASLSSIFWCVSDEKNIYHKT